MTKEKKLKKLNNYIKQKQKQHDKMKQEKNKTIIIDETEYEIETSQLRVAFEDLKIPKGWRLWTVEECIKLHNSKYKKKLGLDDCWFWIKQPFNKFKGKFASGFFAGPDGAGFSCSWDPQYSGPWLGVRFCKDLKHGRKK